MNKNLIKIDQYVQSPNLVEQLNNPDSWGEGQDILSEMLELAKEVELTYQRGFYEGMSTLYQAMNESLVLLAWLQSDGVQIPLLGHQSFTHKSFFWGHDNIFEIGWAAVHKVSTNKRVDINIIDMDIHDKDPFANNPYHAQGIIFSGEITKLITPVEGWKSYERQWMDYQDYLRTDYWQSRRFDTIHNYSDRCALCNRRYFLDLQIHHRTYTRRGHEFDNDLVALCSDCHGMFHKNFEVTND